MKKLIVVGAARSGWGHLQAARNITRELEISNFEIMEIDVLDYAPAGIKIFFSDLWRISSLHMKTVYRFFHNRSTSAHKPPHLLHSALERTAQCILRELVQGRELVAFVSTHPIAAHI